MFYTFGDYERALAEAIVEILASVGVEAEPVAGALPADLPDKTVQVVALGGPMENPGVGRPSVGVHCRALSEGDADLLGKATCGALSALDSSQIDGEHATIVGVTPQNLPYPNPDPRNENYFRVSQTATLIVKARPL